MNQNSKLRTLMQKLDTYKLLISILMGLFCFIGSFFNVNITFSYINIYFVWSQIFFMLVTLSWGRVYGLISLALGGGALYPFFIMSNNGWGCLIPFVILFLWVILTGDNKTVNKKFIVVDRQIYFKQLFYSVALILIYVIIFPILISFNKIIIPFWNKYPIMNISNFLLIVIIIRTILFNFLLLVVADALLILPIIRKLFKLEISKASKYNFRIILTSLIMGWITFLMIVSFQYIVIEKKVIYISFIKNSENYNVLLLLTSNIFIIFGGIISRYIQDNMESLDRIKELNDNLEISILDRTSQLQSAMTELEAFNYTVSHDLKSPLRSIEAYCQFIQEDYKNNMDSELQKMVLNIQNISKYMIEMIIKLLEYSTTTKMTTSLEEVYMETLINDTFSELKVSNNRNMELFIESPLPVLYADRILLKEVISNIIDNSIKFSKKQVKLLIIVRCVEVDNEYKFTFKDNGIGFDMEYSGKLFGVFQRLHSQEGYEGSGIGLATIRKIIQMHGGKTGIEGKVNEGATIYFTIPKLPDQKPT